MPLAANIAQSDAAFKVKDHAIDMINIHNRLVVRMLNGFSM